MASLSFDTSAIDKLVKKLEDPTLKQQINDVLKLKGLVALVSQAINDNFDKQGPGWAPLKPQSIRASVSKKLRKVLKGLTGRELVQRQKEMNQAGEEPYRVILQKTQLLKKTVTTPNVTAMSYDKKKKTAQMGSNIYKTEGTNLIWGTDLIYAGTHNNGNSKMNIPKREFLVIRDEWLVQIEKFVFKKYLEVLKNRLK